MAKFARDRLAPVIALACAATVFLAAAAELADAPAAAPTAATAATR